MNIREIKLRDYLQPNGKYPYARLFSDMEEARQGGQHVAVISVPGFQMAWGTPGDLKRPWLASGEFYKTAKDAINRKNGRA